MAASKGIKARMTGLLLRQHGSHASACKEAKKSLSQLIPPPLDMGPLRHTDVLSVERGVQKPSAFPARSGAARAGTSMAKLPASRAHVPAAGFPLPTFLHSPATVSFVLWFLFFHFSKFVKLLFLDLPHHNCVQ